MDINNVPQEGNAILSGARKVVYARAEDGGVVAVNSRGWEVEEIVTQQAVSTLAEKAKSALVRAKAGQCSSLEYWMYARRMTIDILAQSVGLWKWQVRRHMRVNRFLMLSKKLRMRYADALGLSVDKLNLLP